MQVSTFIAYFRSIGEDREKAKKEAQEALKTIEHGIGGKKFFGGEKIGLADLALGWIAGWLGAMEESADLKLLESNMFPHLQAWIRNFKEVPEIRENTPHHDELLAYFKSLRERSIASARS